MADFLVIGGPVSHPAGSWADILGAEKLTSATGTAAYWEPGGAGGVPGTLTPATSALVMLGAHDAAGDVSPTSYGAALYALTVELLGRYRRVILFTPPPGAR